MNEAALSEFDFIILVDASGSMGETDMPGGVSRWNYMQENLLGFARDVEKIDDDGFDLVTFGGSKIDVVGNTNAAKVKDVFASRQPHGSTPLHSALSQAVGIAGKSKKKVFVAVFTDGIPDDKDAAAKVIVGAGNALTDDTKDRLRFFFVQVGSDPAATQYLSTLDNALPGAKYDIVNAKTADDTNKFASTTELITSAILDQH